MNWAFRSIAGASFHMQRTHQVVIAVTVLLLGVLFGVGALRLTGDTGYAGIGPAFLPAIVAVLLASLGGALLWQAIRGGFPRAPAHDGAHTTDVRGALWVSAGVLGMAAALKFAGFVIAAVFLFVCVARAFGSKRLGLDVLLGVVLVIPIFWLFTLVLDVNLPQLFNKWL
jgi:putative tricarboxylic transport membrane protein